MLSDKLQFVATNRVGSDWIDEISNSSDNTDEVGMRENLTRARRVPSA